MPMIILPNQIAFIRGKQLLENCQLASEIVNGYHKNHGPKRITLKVDIAKAWEIVTTPTDEGGLSIKNMLVWNRCCEIKLMWFVLFKTESVWVAWIHQNVIKDSNFWELKKNNLTVGYSSSYESYKILFISGFILYLVMVSNASSGLTIDAILLL